MEIPVLYEDNNELLVIDKPVSVSVATVADWVTERYNFSRGDKGAEGEFEQRSGIVHRIDKETSGILLIAKNELVYEFLKDLFATRKIKKEYQAMVYGNIQHDRFEVSAPIARDKISGTSFHVAEVGRESETRFVVISRENFGGNPYTYLNVFPKSGRTHQIRVHLKALGHPVVNDSKYANKLAIEISSRLFKRTMLHSKKVGFVDWNNHERTFESPYSLSTDFPNE